MPSTAVQVSRTPAGPRAARQPAMAGTPPQRRSARRTPSPVDWRVRLRWRVLMVRAGFGWPARGEARRLPLDPLHSSTARIWTSLNAGPLHSTELAGVRRAADKELAVTVADSPDRETARPLPTLGGVEPLKQGVAQTAESSPAVLDLQAEATGPPGALLVSPTPPVPYPS
jgi:hypothetical protein